MEIEGFHEVISIIEIAKELHDMGREDLIKSCFCDTLDYDYYYENMINLIYSVFSHCYNKYDDGDECEVHIFMDELISDYYVMAYEYGKRHRIPHSENPYVKAAREEANRWLSYCYSLDWELLAYTKKRATAKQSKLIIRFSICECCGFDKLVYSLLQVYQWFSNECAEFRSNLPDPNQITIWEAIAA